VNKRQKKNFKKWRKSFFYVLVQLAPRDEEISWDYETIKQLSISAAFVLGHRPPNLHFDRIIQKQSNFDRSLQEKTLNEFRNELIDILDNLILDNYNFAVWRNKIVKNVAPRLENKKFGQIIKFYDVAGHTMPYLDFEKSHWYEIIPITYDIETICYYSLKRFLLHSDGLWKTFKKCEACSLPFLPRAKNSRFCRDNCRYSFHNKKG
jgi:hypothetical protein